MKSPLLACLGAASLLTLAALAATNAAAPAAARSEPASGPGESGGGGRAEHVDGTARRPSVVRGAAPALALAAARDNRFRRSPQVLEATP